MAERLKIYACSGIGETKSDYIYWTDNTDTISNTQAVNTLLVRINSLYTRITYLHGISDKERIQALNEIDMYCVMLDAAKRFKDDEKMLYHAGEVISVMDQDGAFDFDSLDNAERDQHLDGLLSRAAEMYGDETIKSEDLAFMADWKDQIIARNKVGLDAEQQNTTKKAMAKAVKGVKGIGAADEAWMQDKEISKYLTKAGTYFLYLYFTKDQLAKLPDVFAKKQKYQQRIYNYCKAYFVDVYGSEEDMQEVIRTGIIQEFKEDPNDLCNAIAEGKRKGVGFIITAITIGAKEFITILAIVASTLIAIVYAICDCVYKSNVKKYAAMESSIVDGGVPDPEDYDGLDFSGSALGGGSSKSKWLPVALVGAAALLLLKK